MRDCAVPRLKLPKMTLPSTGSLGLEDLAPLPYHGTGNGCLNGENGEWTVMGSWPIIHGLDYLLQMNTLAPPNLASRALETCNLLLAACCPGIGHLAADPSHV